ncbi:MAG: hypothetical protein P1U39_00280 [Legionellaceae bacterium]|nr:hypothetical protein [Legionellaceae bacterium]
MRFDGYTDASIKYGIQIHRYDRVKYEFIKTDFVFSVFHLVSTLLQLALVCLCSVFMGFALACRLLSFFYVFLLFIEVLLSNVGVELLTPWLLSVPGLYFLAGVVCILSGCWFCSFLNDMPMMVHNLCVIPACLYHIAIFPFATAFNLFSLINNASYSIVYYFMGEVESRPAYECLAEYINEHPEIKSISLDLGLENIFDVKQLRNVVDSIPHSVEKIELRTPLGKSYSKEEVTILFKALNAVNREKIVFNTQALNDKWETWQNAHTFYRLEQTSEVGRPRLNQDVIRFGIFSYLEPSEMNAMFDVLSPQALKPSGQPS